MTVQTLVSTEIEQDHLLSPVEDAYDAAPDSSLAATQFEAIIRAWKGESVEGAVPASPVGEADWDGNLALGQLPMNDFCTQYTLWGSLGCSWDCTRPYGCTYWCTGPIDPSCDPSTCQLVELIPNRIGSLI